MKKISLSLLAASVMAVAGVARADAIFYPDGTSVELGESGVETLALMASNDLTLAASEDPSSMGPHYTSVLGAGPAIATVTTVTPIVEYVYVQPNINFDRAVAVSQLHSHRAMRHSLNHDGKSASATFNVPARAGEASTMTGGVPNMRTSNDQFVVGSTVIPHHAISDPYYVMSY